MSSPIKSIEVLGIFTECKDNCIHFCIIEYMNNTHHTVKISGEMLVKNYWKYLNDQSKKHLYKIYEVMKVKSIYINPLCLQSSPCQHECILTLDNDTLEDDKITKTLKGDIIANNYWDKLTDSGKIHFGIYKKDINYSKLSID